MPVSARGDFGDVLLGVTFSFTHREQFHQLAAEFSTLGLPTRCLSASR